MSERTGQQSVSAVLELERVPRGGALYRRAAMTLVGRRHGPDLPALTVRRRDVLVDRDLLARYARVCGLRVGDRLPATYPHVLAFPLMMRLMCQPEFPVPVVGLVHVANRFETREPLHAGQALDLRVTASDLRPHRRGRIFDLVTTASVDDRVRWRGVSTFLYRGRTDAHAPTAAATGADGDEAGEAGIAERHGRVVADRSGPSAIWSLPPDLGRRYARVSGDRNPIHTSRLGARVFGFRTPIAHGMWTAARCLAALEGRLPERYLFDVAFKRPVPLPGTVAFSAVPARFHPPDAPAGPGWRLSVSDLRSGRQYLTGGVLGLPG